MAFFQTVPIELRLDILQNWLNIDFTQLSSIDQAITSHATRPEYLNTLQCLPCWESEDEHSVSRYQKHPTQTMGHLQWITSRQLPIRKVFIPFSLLPNIVTNCALHLTKLKNIETIVFVKCGFVDTVMTSNVAKFFQCTPSVTSIEFSQSNDLHSFDEAAWTKFVAALCEARIPLKSFSIQTNTTLLSTELCHSFVSEFSQLEELLWQFYMPSKEGLMVIAENCKNLRAIQFDVSRLTSSDLQEFFSSCPTILSIDLMGQSHGMHSEFERSADVLNDSLVAFLTMIRPQLQLLRFTGQEITTGRGFTLALQGFPNIQELCFNYSRRYRVSAHNGVSSYRVLELGFMSGAEVQEVLRVCPQPIHELDLPVSFAPLSPQEIDVVIEQCSSELVSLELGLQPSAVTNSDLERLFRKFPRLKRLHMHLSTDPDYSLHVLSNEEEDRYEQEEIGMPGDGVANRLDQGLITDEVLLMLPSLCPNINSLCLRGFRRLQESTMIDILRSYGNRLIALQVDHCSKLGDGFALEMRAQCPFLRSIDIRGTAVAAKVRRRTKAFYRKRYGDQLEYYDNDFSRSFDFDYGMLDDDDGEDRIDPIGGAGGWGGYDYDEDDEMDHLHDVDSERNSAGPSSAERLPHLHGPAEALDDYSDGEGEPTRHLNRYNSGSSEVFF